VIYGWHGKRDEKPLLCTIPSSTLHAVERQQLISDERVKATEKGAIESRFRDIE
jgi:hypothetical protein